MKNIFLKECIDSLSNDIDFAINNKHHREELLATFPKLKSSVPFSPRLNRWLTDWYLTHNEIFYFAEDDDFDFKDIKGTFNRHLEEFRSTGRIRIWTPESSNTVFGEDQVNVYFRCFHSYIHIVHQAPYTLIGESTVCCIQMSYLPQDWLLERELFLIEILGQNLYYAKHKIFLRNQRLFAYDFMRDPDRAILTRQI
ncbi:hypothetical protein [Chryseobacterium sp. SL1]|uniref:hypothetical protein n=1 Tax=Chryseobacterium sp. SL1 TaxID=2995159 RepID=UPI0022722F41|nr:hypothetical protein [Chryseobacterium sp. SL1]MCY1660116.1 hypothetical protein [Chryseobacterium sp. SL1]